jgi:hypothetical protein
MVANSPQFIIDTMGEKVSVVLPIKDYEYMLEELEDLDDIRLYDEAKKEDNGEYVLFSDYLKNRKQHV